MRSLPVCALLMLLLAPVHAADNSDATRTARRFLQQQTVDLADEVRITMHALDARLSTCTHPQPFLPGNGQRLLGRVTVGLRCDDGRTRYVQARVDARGTYWVAARNLGAGTRITPDMLEARQGDLAQLPREAVMEPEQAVGRVTTRSLTHGGIMQTTQLRQPDAVQRNRTVTVAAGGRGFRATRQGLALQSGAIGDNIRVRMSDHTLLSGTVAGDGLVEVGR